MQVRLGLLEKYNIYILISLCGVRPLKARNLKCAMKYVARRITSV